MDGSWRWGVGAAPTNLGPSKRWCSRLAPTPCAQPQAAAEIGKPLVLEEFGKEASEGQITSVRDPW